MVKLKLSTRQKVLKDNLSFTKWVSSMVVKSVEELQSNTVRAVVWCREERGSDLDTCMSVKQGGLLSAHLFSLYEEYLDGGGVLIGSTGN